jgi:hypothetical protein
MALGGRPDAGAPLASPPAAPQPREPGAAEPCGEAALRLLPDAPSVPPPAGEPSSAQVLLAGADAPKRAALRAELSASLPRRTWFAEADEVSQALARAPFSRLVILAGDLRDGSSDSLMHMLGLRHPQLPVVCVVDEPARAAAGAHS